jgi:hypothetical protein
MNWDERRSGLGEKVNAKSGSLLRNESGRLPCYAPVT